jgi:hypothetical protein
MEWIDMPFKVIDIAIADTKVAKYGHKTYGIMNVDHFRIAEVHFDFTTITISTMLYFDLHDHRVDAVFMEIAKKHWSTGNHHLYAKDAQKGNDD